MIVRPPTLERPVEAGGPEPPEVLFREARRRRRRRWAIGVAGLATAAILAFVGYGAAGNSTPRPPSSSKSLSTPAAIGTAWRTDGTMVFEHTGPGNYSGFTPTTTITCAGSSATTCYVAIHANGILPDGRPSTPGKSGAYATAFVSSEFISRDQGRTWHQVDLPDKAWTSTAFSCPTPRDCAVGGLVGAKNGRDSFIHPTVVVLTTTDAGRTWTLHHLPASAGMVRSLDCVTVETCIAKTWTPTATRIDTMLPFSGAGRIFPIELYVSQDAGASWHAVQIPRLPAHYVFSSYSALACPTTARCILPGSRSHVVQVPGGYTGIHHVQSYRGTHSQPLLVTVHLRTDHATVERLRSGPALRYWSGAAFSCGSVAHCLMITASRVSGPEVFASTSGGRSWSKVSSHYTPTAPPSLQCISTTSCITATGAMTGDGGRYWALPQTRFSAISCSASGICVGLQPISIYDPRVSVARSSVGATRVVTNAPR